MSKLSRFIYYYTDPDGERSPGNYEYHTESGSVVSFETNVNAPLRDLKVSIEPVQSGSGDPSPDNLRPISGRTGLTLYHSGADTSDYDELAVSWQSQAGTIYGGVLDVTTGLLTVDRVLATLDGSMSWTVYSSSGTQRGFLLTAANAGIEDAMAGTTSVTAPYIKCSLLPAGTSTWTHGTCGMQNKNIWFGFQSSDFNGVASFKAYLNEHPVQMIVPVGTPATYQLTPKQVRTIKGTNNIWSNAGNVTVTYPVK